MLNKSEDKSNSLGIISQSQSSETSINLGSYPVPINSNSPNSNQTQFIEFSDSQENLLVDEPSLKRDSSYTKEDKSKRGLVATEIDIEKLKNIEDIPYRHIVFSKIPNHLKPKYEQEELLKACSSIMDLLEIRDKYIFYDEYNLQHPLDFAICGHKSSLIPQTLS